MDPLEYGNASCSSPDMLGLPNREIGNVYLSACGSDGSAALSVASEIYPELVVSSVAFTVYVSHPKTDALGGSTNLAVIGPSVLNR
jgi:hypothetical protein